MAYDESLNILLDIDTKGADATLGRLQGVFSSAMGVGKAFLGTIAAIEVAIIGVGYAASRKGAEFEALENSLIAVEGSAKRASKAMEELRDIAKGPGLGVTEAIQTFAGLRRGGIDSGLSMSLTREIGNAIAMSGGGREQLGRAGLALGQIAMKGGVQGDELLQLSEAGIPAHRLLKEAFGTADGGELKKKGVDAAKALEALTEGLAKLPRVTGGAKNSFENLSDAFDYGMAQMGKGINAGVLPFINDLTTSMEKINSGGLLTSMGESIGTQFIGLMESITGGSDSLTVLEAIHRGVLITGYAAQNIVENTKGLISGIGDIVTAVMGEEKPFITVDEWKRRNPGKDFTDMPGTPYFRDGRMVIDDPSGELPQPLGLDPVSMADREIEAARERRRMKEQGKTQGVFGWKDDKIGGQLIRKVYVPGEGYIDEDKLTDAQRKKAEAYKAGRSGDGMEDPVTTPSAAAPKGEVVSILSKIAEHTKTMSERMYDVMTGGGAALEDAFSAHNIGQWSGSGNKGAKLIIQGVQMMQGEALISAARNRSFSPQSR